MVYFDVSARGYGEICIDVPDAVFWAAAAADF